MKNSLIDSNIKIKEINVCKIENLIIIINFLK